MVTHIKKKISHEKGGGILYIPLIYHQLIYYPIYQCNFLFFFCLTLSNDTNLLKTEIIKICLNKIKGFTTRDVYYNNVFLFSNVECNSNHIELNDPKLIYISIKI